MLSNSLYRLFLTEGKLQLRGFQKHQDKVQESSRMRLFSWQSFNTETWLGLLVFVLKEKKRYLSMSLCLTKALIISFLVSPTSKDLLTYSYFQTWITKFIVRNYLCRPFFNTGSA